MVYGTLVDLTMPDFSIITCISDPSLYNHILLESAHRARGKHDIEFVPVINTNNQYSAADACNIGIELARSDRLIFVHQDVRFLGDDWFAYLDLIIGTLPEEWAVVSAAGIGLKYGRYDIGKWGGAIHTDTVGVGQVWHTDEDLHLPPYWNGDTVTQKMHAADECLLVLNRKHDLRFDAKFAGFHFYGIDICLQARAAGYDVYGSNLPIIHYGKHSNSLVGDQKYWVYLRYLHNKWKYLFPDVYTTHMHWNGDQITSYIATSLEPEYGPPVTIRAMGLGKVNIAGDHHWGFE